MFSFFQSLCICQKYIKKNLYKTTLYYKDLINMHKLGKNCRIQATTISLFLTYSLCWEKQNGLIYILLWSPAFKEPFNYLGMGQYPFIKRNCTFQNCFITNDRSYLNSILDFDVLIYNAFFFKFSMNTIPENRSESQEYVLAAVEPASYYPVWPEYNSMFNITWTYKLSSDVVYPYIYIKKMDGEVIGPKKEMHWIDKNNMDTTLPEIVEALRSKSVAAAWIASNCYTTTERRYFVYELQGELIKYGHRVDIYGDCGGQECPRGAREHECHEKIERDYYFFLAFENSFCEDYVTEKILHGLNHNAVPVVLGGANYTRFMPDGAYLDAGQLGVAGLAKEMNDIINNPARYLDFFRWRRYYTYHNANEDDYRATVCEFCALLNNSTRRNQRAYYRNMTRWWNEWGLNKVYPTTATLPPVVPEEPNAVVQVLSGIYNYFFPDS